MKNDGVQPAFLSMHDDSVFQIVNIAIFSVLIIDIAIYSISGIAPLTPVVTYEVVLAILNSVMIVCQILVLELMKRKDREIMAKAPYLGSLGKIVWVSQYVLSGILFLIALQVVLFSSYQTGILMVGVSFSYALAMLLMGTLALLLFKWYIRNKTFPILIYGVASISAIFSFLLFAVLVDYVLPGLPAERDPGSRVNLFIFQDPIGSSILGLGAISNLVAFLLYWVSTVVLLKHYAMRIGRVRFWAIMISPVFFFVFRYTVIVPLLATLAGSPDTNLVYLTIFNDVFVPTVAGLIYGFPFLSVSHSLKSGNIMLKRYLAIAFWGSVLLQIGASMHTAPYPPFGFATALVQPVICFMVLFGIYSSAISISSDQELRKSIRKHAIEESRFLSDIGSADMVQTLENKVSELEKKRRDLAKETSGVQLSITPEEAQDYLQEVLNEIKKTRT